MYLSSSSSTDAAARRAVARHCVGHSHVSAEYRMRVRPEAVSRKTLIASIAQKRLEDREHRAQHEPDGAEGNLSRLRALADLRLHAVVHFYGGSRRSSGLHRDGHHLGHELADLAHAPEHGHAEEDGREQVLGHAAYGDERLRVPGGEHVRVGHEVRDL
ncbi:PP159 [Orf virus]|uniref:PP159 n=1 Tax=Orf virus TaxID=10258 RepID=F1AWY4_ORFV|nr:PP159 [Orf virus]